MGNYFSLRKAFLAALEKGASDLHLSPELPPMARVNGSFQALDDFPVLYSPDIKLLIEKHLDPDSRAAFKELGSVDFSVSCDGVPARFRGNAFRQDRGVSAVFRVVPAAVPSLDMLGAPPVIHQIPKLHKGLVLVTGATGSGKSTTLAAIINEINETQSKHIITLEDPIEFVHKNKKSIISQRAIGKDAKSFASALKAALREDPDVILVGEMRDRESISLALTAAETGHLVLSTLHTSSAAKAVNRIIDVFPAGEKPFIQAMLSESLQAVIAQTLLPRVGGGRVAAHEVLIGTPAVRNMIRESKISQIPSIMQSSKKAGMVLMENSVSSLYEGGLIDREVAESYLSLRPELSADSGLA